MTNNSSKLGIVILHYGDENITTRCIDSIINNVIKNTDSYYIVVVSNDFNTIKIEKYVGKIKKGHRNIFFLSNKENLGFAKGMNLGITYLRKNFGIKNIVCLNNDIIIKQADFFDKLIKPFMINKSIGIIGPRIISFTGIYQNPMRERKLFIKEIIYRILKNQILFMITYVPWLYKYLKLLKTSKQRLSNFKNYLTPKKNVILHGSCFLLTESFFQHYEGLYSNTFLYLEEIFLFEMVKKVNLSTYYNPEAHLIHEQHKSASWLFNNDFFKVMRSRYKEESKSLFKLLVFKLRIIFLWIK